MKDRKKCTAKDDEFIIEQILSVIKNSIHEIEFDIPNPKLDEVDYLKKLVVKNLTTLRKLVCQNSNIIFSSGYCADGNKPGVSIGVEKRKW